MSDFGAEARRLMAEQGLSLRELARRAHWDASHLSKVLNGHKPPTASLAVSIGDVLGARETLTGLAAGPVFNGSLTSDARDRLTWIAQHPSRADAAAIESLGSVLAAQRRAEDSLGSAAILRPVRSQLAVVGDLVAEARGPLRPAVIDAAQQWAQFAGWLHLNLGEQPQAKARFRQALEHAEEINDQTMIATILSFRGYAAWRAGEPGPVIGLAQAAQRNGKVALSQRAYAAALEARGHALAGDAAATERKIGVSIERAERLYGHSEENRPWSYWYTPGFFACQRGVVLSHFSHIPRFRDEATNALTEGYAALAEEEKGSDWAGGYLAALAAVHEQAGDVEHACAVALQVAGIARRTGSARLRGMLARLRDQMEARWPGDPRVRELKEALRST